MVNPKTREEFVLLPKKRYEAMQKWIAPLKRRWDDPADDDLLESFDLSWVCLKNNVIKVWTADVGVSAKRLQVPESSPSRAAVGSNASGSSSLHVDVENRAHETYGQILEVETVGRVLIPVEFNP